MRVEAMGLMYLYEDQDMSRSRGRARRVYASEVHTHSI